jgi:DNA-binding NarL/FixJ family response regulator
MLEKDKRILIVDDDDTSLDLLLNTLGYEVETETDGQKALSKIFNNKNYDLIILDILMPEIDGWQVLKTIRNNPDTESIPVIILSCLNNINYEISALKKGADDYIAKPFKNQELFARIESLLRRSNNYNTILINLPFDYKFNNDLTSRQKEILGIISKGLSNKEIARTLNISEKTIKAHIKSIFEKLNVANRTQAVLVGIKEGILENTTS